MRPRAIASAAIVEPPVAPQRRADDEHGPQLRAFRGEPRDPGLDRVEEGVLQEQVVDRVGGEVELGKDGEVDAARVRLAGQLQRLVDVEGDVAGRGARARRGDADEAVAVDRAERGLLGLPFFATYSISVIISTATSSAATRTAPRPTAPKCSSRCAVIRPGARASEMDQPRLVAGVGEAGDGKRDIGARAGERALGHRHRDLLRNRALVVDQRRRARRAARSSTPRYR